MSTIAGLTGLQLSDLLLLNVPCVDDSCPVWRLHCSFRLLLLFDCKVYFCRDLSSFVLYASSSSAATSLNSAGSKPQSHCCFGKDIPPALHTHISLYRAFGFTTCEIHLSCIISLLSWIMHHLDFRSGHLWRSLASIQEQVSEWKYVCMCMCVYL